MLIVILLASCAPGRPAGPSGTALATNTTSATATHTPVPTSTPTPTPQKPVLVPAFDHIVVVIFENRDYGNVIGNPAMPYLNQYAKLNVLLTNYYAVTHPSLPNYIALVSGGTQGITSDCENCFIDAPNLADSIEAAGRTWKAYEESMPAPCTLGISGEYAQKHNPFIYFDSIRLDAARCNRSIVPLTDLTTDLAAGHLPDFSLIEPNLCNSGHDCASDVVDGWINQLILQLQNSSTLGSNYLIAITFDEALGTSVGSCCGMGPQAGGRVATILISPQARRGIGDGRAYSHYSLLKTIETAWGLPLLGASASSATPLITYPWLNASSTITTPGSATGQPSPTPAAGSQLRFPIRAAFFYPWFPEAWSQQGLDPFSHYFPSLGFYSQDDPALIDLQIEAMQYGGIQAGIASWWGPVTPTDTRMPSLLAEGEKKGFRWSIYYEQEGSRDPPVTEIRSELLYIQKQYAASAAYLKIDGRFVVFVYADPQDGCGMVNRWLQANAEGQAYLVMKVFPGYQDCGIQPDGWHQYAPANSWEQVGDYSFIISPGFWKAGESEPALVRDLNRWNENIRNMLAAHVQFQLITTYNEWGEGTAVESADAWQSASGYGSYLDALHNNGKSP